ncbi:helix-turn-helix domain-containing protein [Bdellovibrionota bacterium FG-2]
MKIQNEESMGAQPATLLHSNPKPFWNVDDVANALSCATRHVYRLVSRDKIPYAKIGKKLVRFHPDRITEWVLKGGTR